MKKRNLSDSDASSLSPGEAHYRSYVGPPERYDLMGAMQFRLLSTLGLRETHRVLDFGCGSLRAGRLLIPYLLARNYFGIEPNRWLIEDGIARHLGHDIIQLKSPEFAYNGDFSVPFREAVFDFILAQSIFSHCGSDVLTKLLDEFARVLAPKGLVVATFSISHQDMDFEGEGWIYPGCVRYREDTIVRHVQKAGLAAKAIPFFHPSQRWFLMAHEERQLPTDAQMPLLRGAVFNVEEFVSSIQIQGVGNS